jgi:hypothetical protein
MRFAKTAAALVGAAALAGVVLAAAPAAAAPLATPGPAGYLDTGGPFTSVAANWTVPTVTCATRNRSDGADVGIDIADTNPADGLGSATAELGSRCWGESVYYYPVVCVQQCSGIAVEHAAPGDAMSAAITRTGTEYTTTLTDTTEGWSQSATAQSTTPLNNGSVGFSVFPVDPAVSTFGPVHFTGVTVDGQVPSAAALTAQNDPLTTVGAFTNDGFTVTESP